MIKWSICGDREPVIPPGLVDERKNNETSFYHHNIFGFEVGKIFQVCEALTIGAFIYRCKVKDKGVGSGVACA